MTRASITFHQRMADDYGRAAGRAIGAEREELLDQAWIWQERADVEAAKLKARQIALAALVIPPVPVLAIQSMGGV